MSDQEIKVLNSITKTLIDSRKGYETCCDIVDNDYTLSAEFGRRRDARAALVGEFQARVRVLGGEPEDDGSAVGAVHRAFTRFSALFQDDQNAAASALDDGEEFLAEKIEDRLEDSSLDAATEELLRKALRSAKDGERFADSLDD